MRKESNRWEEIKFTYNRVTKQESRLAFKKKKKTGRHRDLMLKSYY